MILLITYYDVPIFSVTVSPVLFCLVIRQHKFILKLIKN